jgi:hypothetical protein
MGTFFFNYARSECAADERALIGRIAVCDPFFMRLFRVVTGTLQISEIYGIIGTRLQDKKNTCH